MDIDQLRSFDRIVRDGSFTKAAARLNVTQATISMRIKALESAAGGALFARGRKVALTERGQAFLPYARRILSTLVESEEAMRSMDRGHLTLATLRSVVPTLVTRPVSDFLAAHPRVALDVEEGRHRDIAEWLHDRRVDLAIIAWPNVDPLLDPLEPLALFSEKARLVAAPALAAAIGPAPTLDRVFEIAPRFVTHLWWQVTPEAILAMNRRARTTSLMPLEPSRDLIDAGAAIGHLLAPQVEPDIASGRLVEIEPVDMPPMTRRSALVAGFAEAAARPLVADLAARLIARAEALRILEADRR
ncbi:LysR family transcriptional regulator [Mesorhizobium sp. BR1-1-16]|uniref:LysR family transcriptional regulator n=1 Tax=Mesorhizobium sp. BR1-1-16 TaxID=2876653 RepID=UPI001CCCE0BF|nr:LysR family transcriptional regulator [Mesorhizobium sp. BR1-1-16]MBZ9937140.1 LysR family transcriptional regulator [Mesorhizobium sp. BR1-1-16]